MQLCRVEHFFNIFVLTFGRDSYCIQHFFTSFEIGTLIAHQALVNYLRPCVLYETGYNCWKGPKISCNYEICTVWCLPVWTLAYSGFF